MIWSVRGVLDSLSPPPSLPHCKYLSFTGITNKEKEEKERRSEKTRDRERASEKERENE